jgi:c-di-GMP-binding flagellar brake protein YcgR
MVERQLSVESNLNQEEFDARFDERDDEPHEEKRRVAREGMVERRVHTRYAVDAWAEVLVKDGTMLFRGRVLDVSVGGCYIETEAKLKLAPGTRVEMVFRVNSDVFRCDAMSRMVRTTGAGFLFANQDARMQRELGRLIQELERGEG